MDVLPEREKTYPAPEFLRPLHEADAPAFHALCRRDPQRFLTPRLNIETHGFSGKTMRTWGAFGRDKKTLLGVAMRFSNTFVAVDGSGECSPLFAELIDREQNIAGVRGTTETINALRPALQNYRITHRDDSTFLQLKRPPICSPQRMAFARRALPADLDKLAVLYSGAGAMYRSRVNVAAKLETNRVWVVEETTVGWRNGRIVSCALLNVEGGDAGLIGGVYTLPAARGKGYAAACTAALSRDLQRDGKTPCLFYENPIAGRVYRRMGFEYAGQWAVIYLSLVRR